VAVFFNAAGGGVGVIWFMHCVLFSSVFCLLRSGSGFVFRLPRRIEFCYWFRHFGGDNDGSEMEVMRGVVVATDLSWTYYWQLRWI
jgi:hypothetical protein